MREELGGVYSLLARKTKRGEKKHWLSGFPLVIFVSLASLGIAIDKPDRFVFL